MFADLSRRLTARRGQVDGLEVEPGELLIETVLRGHRLVLLKLLMLLPVRVGRRYILLGLRPNFARLTSLASRIGRLPVDRILIFHGQLALLIILKLSFDLGA